MNIPKPIAEQMASIEAEITEIEAQAARRVQTLRERLDIYSFVIEAFAAGEIPPVVPATLSLKARVFELVSNNGPMTAKQIGIALGEEFHGIGAALGALSKTYKIMRVGREWTARA